MGAHEAPTRSTCCPQERIGQLDVRPDEAEVLAMQRNQSADQSTLCVYPCGHVRALPTRENHAKEMSSCSRTGTMGVPFFSGLSNGAWPVHGLFGLLSLGRRAWAY